MATREAGEAPRVPAVSPERLQELAHRAEAETCGGNGCRPGPSGEAGGFTRLGAVLAAEPRVLGRPEPEPCPDCGQPIRKREEAAASWLTMWVPERHECPVRARREAEEAARAAARREAWLRSPPRERVAEVVRRTGIPGMAAGGLEIVREAEVPPAALEAVRSHRERWLSGMVPQRGLWLWGRTGRRKTLLTAALLYDVSHRTDRAARFWNLEHLMEQLRREARGAASAWDPEAVERADLLAIDDIGTVKVTESVWRTLFGLVNGIDAAYGELERHRALYVTSNENPDRVVSLYAVGGDEGERIVRRLVEQCEVVEV